MADDRKKSRRNAPSRYPTRVRQRSKREKTSFTDSRNGLLLFLPYVTARSKHAKFWNVSVVIRALDPGRHTPEVPKSTSKCAVTVRRESEGKQLFDCFNDQIDLGNDYIFSICFYLTPRLGVRAPNFRATVGNKSGGSGPGRHTRSNFNRYNTHSFNVKILVI